ncbi:unnamed protein product, partial [Didymodactylos carnosus]
MSKKYSSWASGGAVKQDDLEMKLSSVQGKSGQNTGETPERVQAIVPHTYINVDAPPNLPNQSITADTSERTKIWPTEKSQDSVGTNSSTKRTVMALKHRHSKHHHRHHHHAHHRGKHSDRRYRKSTSQPPQTNFLQQNDQKQPMVVYRETPVDGNNNTSTQHYTSETDDQ